MFWCPLVVSRWFRLSLLRARNQHLSILNRYHLFLLFSKQDACLRTHPVVLNPASSNHFPIFPFSWSMSSAVLEVLFWGSRHLSNRFPELYVLSALDDVSPHSPAQRHPPCTCQSLASGRCLHAHPDSSSGFCFGFYLFGCLPNLYFFGHFFRFFFAAI